MTDPADHDSAISAITMAEIRTEGAAAPPELPLHRTGPRPGVDVADRDRLYDLMEGR
jgi:hypothetical protein